MKPKKKERKPRLSFAARLEQKLAGVFGTVDVGCLSDNSAHWVSLRRGGKQVNFTFDASQSRNISSRWWQNIKGVYIQKINREREMKLRIKN